ncbi:MAG: hypothetical protein VXZ07_02400, partial [Pseudomonadota bacterium]|nr:hypothetical protein [Pseudomonadota bacterium]
SKNGSNFSGSVKPKTLSRETPAPSMTGFGFEIVVIGLNDISILQSNNFTIVITAIVIPNAKEIIITNPRIFAILLRKCGTSKFLISRDLIL